jgi:hypothetical protein
MPTMVHKTTGRSRPVPRVEARQAAESAFDYFTTLFSNTRRLEPEPNLNLEEIEMSKDGRYWLVTLGFNVPRPNDPRLPKFLQVPLRTLKVFKVDAATGKVLSMKIPQEQ